MTSDKFGALARTLVRPIVTLTFVGAMVVIGVMGATGNIEPEDAAIAASFVGTPGGIVVGYWFADRTGVNLAADEEENDDA